MVTTIVNLLKHNPLIWKLAKMVVYTLLAIKAWLWVAYYNLWFNLGFQGICGSKVAAAPLIVSFTSYGHRIRHTHVTVQSILNQSLKPNRVILWLGHGESITPKLKQLMKRGLEIRYTEDIRAYTKIIPTLVNFPDNIVVTADDDIIYPKNWLQKLWQEHLQAPQAICCHRAHLITRTHQGKVAPYNDWEWCITGTEHTAAIFPTGVGGVLYPPGSLHAEVTNIAMFRDLCPYADDIWLKAMSLKQGTPCRIVSRKPLLIPVSLPNTQTESALRTINIDNNQNDVQFAAVFTHYDLYKLLD